MFSAVLNQPSLRETRVRPALILTTLSLALMSTGASSQESASIVGIGDYFKALNSRAELRFGDGIAVSGNLMPVSSTAEDGASTGIDGDPTVQTKEDSGAVHVFVREPGGWTQQAYLKPSNSDVQDNFGAAVAIDGDLLVIGAPNEDSNATGVNGDPFSHLSNQSGAAYVHRIEGSTVVQEAYL
ncbi:MAG TPA: FG-GAP repeat protein [Dokdonella sp.]|uniref:FG-GAP repeat protein n=1 Tax=Dokdonella sp. TaxID=2291710 RepID=UPI002D7F62BC|nr:FG-GAP repeat protein [Dokdonella sp.]HET9033788.1 FG-GAP repeat protein [Dokdonella sp.]